MNFLWRRQALLRRSDILMLCSRCPPSPCEGKKPLRDHRRILSPINEFRSNEFQGRASLARQHRLPHARVTQLLDLILLAPDIQEQILVLDP